MQPPTKAPKRTVGVRVVLTNLQVQVVQQAAVQKAVAFLVLLILEVVQVHHPKVHHQVHLVVQEVDRWYR